MDNAAGDAAPCTYIQKSICYDTTHVLRPFAVKMCFFRGKSVSGGISVVNYETFI